MVGDRSGETANFFMDDLAGRLADRVLLMTDGHHVYLDAVAGNEIDYAMLVKLHRENPTPGPERKSALPNASARSRHLSRANPIVGTSHVERQKLNIRMAMRRFTRLTNAFSKKIDNHIHALSLYFVFYNFVRTHKAHKLSPAMAAGVRDRLWSIEDIVALVDAPAPKPGRRGPRQKGRADSLKNVVRTVRVHGMFLMMHNANSQPKMAKSL